jgi:archaemetzincin
MSDMPAILKETPDTIFVSPVGEMAPWIARTLTEKMEAFFGFKTKVLPLLSNITFAFDPDRNQYHSTLILEQLAARCPPGGLKVLAVIKEDLFIPILTHVYGEAQLGGTACIISISRLLSGYDMGGVDSDASRIVKEAIHELGHCFDLRHCEDEHCIMHYCRKLEDVDKKSNRFCLYCEIFLSDNIKALEG